MVNTEDVLIRLDGVKWWIVKQGGRRIPLPLCPKHNLRLTPVDPEYPDLSRALECDECDRAHKIPRTYDDEQKYVLNKIDSKHFRQMKTINLDDEAVPLAVDRIDSSGDSPYWIEARLVESKIGRRVVVYAGHKGREGKTQIFVEPDIQRLSFDHTDRHPSEIFLKVEATFDSGNKSTMSKAT